MALVVTEGRDGSRVDEMVAAGRIDEVACYCETDVVNTYRLWLIHELFRGALSEDGLRWSEPQLASHLRQSKTSNPHLQAAADLIEVQ